MRKENWRVGKVLMKLVLRKKFPMQTKTGPRNGIQKKRDRLTGGNPSDFDRFRIESSENKNHFNLVDYPGHNYFQF